MLSEMRKARTFWLITATVPAADAVTKALAHTWLAR